MTVVLCLVCVTHKSLHCFPDRSCQNTINTFGVVKSVVQHQKCGTTLFTTPGHWSKRDMSVTSVTDMSHLPHFWCCKKCGTTLLV